MIRIGIDAMGGDNAPKEIVKGAILATKLNKELSLTLVGDEEKINCVLDEQKADRSHIEVVHATEVIEGDDQPVKAIRRKKDSSLVVMMNLLKEGKLDAVVSAGNTGALLAGGIFIAGRIEGVSRPAITGIYPSLNPTVILDIGANADVSPEHLVEFAKMGSIFAKIAFKKDDIKVGLINIGTEETKGNELVKKAYPLLKETQEISFYGNVEARDIPKGIVDVAVCDGFTGNTILKLTEGLAETIFAMMKEVVYSSTKAKMGALLMKDSLKGMKDSLNYEEVGGAVLLGVDGVVVKAHGSSNAKAFSNAILRAAEYHHSGLIAHIKEVIS